MASAPFFNDDLNRARHCRIRNIRPRQEEPKVVSIYNGETIRAPGGHPELIERAEELLRAVQSGRLAGLAWVGVTWDGAAVMSHRTIHMSPLELLGALHRLTDRVNGGIDYLVENELWPEEGA